MVGFASCYANSVEVQRPLTTDVKEKSIGVAAKKGAGDKVFDGTRARGGAVTVRFSAVGCVLDERGRVKGSGVEWHLNFCKSFYGK